MKDFKEELLVLAILTMFLITMWSVHVMKAA